VDVVIHNAGVFTSSTVLPVNVVAPYLLTALVHRPHRLVYLSSDMHGGGRPSLTGVDWTGRSRSGSYSDSKLFVTTLAMAAARIVPGLLSNAVDRRVIRIDGPASSPVTSSQLIRREIAAAA
jgi:hypothetical protein